MNRSLRTATAPALEAVPGLVHGFEQRLGPVGWETRDAGRRRVSQALAPDGRLLFLKQVHGDTVLRAPWDGTPAGDAAIADSPGLLLAIETADCFPILIVDAPRRRVAAAHAGWRGASAGIVRRTVQALVADGSEPGALLAAVGPGIAACCYEVGEDLHEALGPDARRFFRPGPRGRPHLDLRGFIEGQLVESGLRSSSVHHVNDCTFCQPDLYHSYRREGPGGGRMVSYIGWRRS